MEGHPTRWLGRSDAAKYLGIGKTKLGEITAAGRVQSVKRDGHRVYLAEWLDAYQLGLESGDGAEPPRPITYDDLRRLRISSEGVTLESETGKAERRHSLLAGGVAVVTSLVQAAQATPWV